MSNRKTEEPGKVQCKSVGRPGRLANRQGYPATFSVLYFSVLLFCAFPSCRPAAAPPPVPAFYHWQTRLDLTAAEIACIDALGIQKLYVKVFDVDWDEDREQAVPMARLEVVNPYPGRNLEYIPAVFITNRTLDRLDDDAIPELAGRIYSLLNDLTRAAGWTVAEIQLDCDWTETTRDKFFALLEALRRQLDGRPMILSATIRLHQIRYPARTGVPPADRGMLMCYNVGDLSRWEESNSILAASQVAPYLDAAPYPLPLDVALPVFGWGVLFRQGRMIRLINGLSTRELADTTRFTNLGDSRYEVVKSTYLQGYYLYRGDRIRLEAAGLAELDATAALLAAWLPPRERTVAFYHLDTTTIKNFPNNELERIIEKVAGRKDRGSAD